MTDDTSPPVDPLIGQVLADRYRLIRVLGEGGMGRVYLGEHVRMGRLSAIKVMHPAMVPTADAIGRFNREAANACRINDPHVAAIYDFGETADGTLYLAMEYVEGENLSQRVNRLGPLSIAQATKLTQQVAQALDAAHRLGIVHRDLKPDNILVTQSPSGEEMVKVVDFGIAKSMRKEGQTVTMAGIAIGTPEFMSPEQLAGEELDHRSDIYSLGLVVYAMLTGKLPYPEPSSKEALIQRLTARPRSLSELSPAKSWPAPMQTALDRALSPEASARQTSASAFATELSGTAAPEQQATRRMTPLATKPVPESVVPAMSALKGNRSRATVLTALLLVIAAGGVLAWNSMRSNNPQIAIVDSAHIAPPLADTAKTVADSVKPAPESTVVSAPPPVAMPTPRSVATDSATPKPKAALKAPNVETIAADQTLPGDKPRNRHAWLRASGDSSGNALPNIPPVQAEAREIMGHMNRAKHFLQVQEPMRALTEFRTAFEEHAAFSAEHANTPEARMMTQQFRMATMQLAATCRTASDSAVAHGRNALSCDNLERSGQLQQQRGRRGGRGALPR